MPGSIVGVWRVVGADMTEAVLLKIIGGKIPDELVEFTENNRMRVWWSGNAEPHRYKYRLHEGTEPAAIDLYKVNPPGTCKAIYRIEGDRLVICIASEGTPRPTDFAVRSTEHVLVRYERSGEQPAPRRSKRGSLLKPGRLIPEGFLDEADGTIDRA